MTRHTLHLPCYPLGPRAHNHPQPYPRVRLNGTTLVTAEQQFGQQAMSAGLSHAEYIPHFTADRMKHKIFLELLAANLGDPIL